VRPYTYRIPDDLAARAAPGARVVVPLQRRRVVALVTAVDVPPPSVAARPILDAPDPEPALSPALLELGRWISRYYGTPLGLALRAILPGPLWSVQRPAGPAAASERVVVLAQPLGSLLEREQAFRRAPRRRAAYEALEALGGSAPARHLVDQLKISPAVLDGLVTQGLARVERVAALRDPFAGLSSPPPPVLTADQRRVVDLILAGPPEVPALVHGVSGSGRSSWTRSTSRATSRERRRATTHVTPRWCGRGSRRGGRDCCSVARRRRWKRCTWRGRAGFAPSSCRSASARGRYRPSR